MKARLVNSGPLSVRTARGEPRKHAAWSKQAHDVRAADAVVHGNVHAFAGEVIDDGQALDPAAIGQRVEDEVHAPGVVRHTRRQQFLAFADRSG